MMLAGVRWTLAMAGTWGELDFEGSPLAVMRSERHKRKIEECLRNPTAHPLR